MQEPNMDELFKNAEKRRIDEGGYPGIWNPEYGMMHNRPQQTPPPQQYGYGWPMTPYTNPNPNQSNEQEVISSANAIMIKTDMLVDQIHRKDRLIEQLAKMLGDEIKINKTNAQTIATLVANDKSRTEMIRDMEFNNREREEALQNLIRQQNEMPPADDIGSSIKNLVHKGVDFFFGKIRSWISK